MSAPPRAPDTADRGSARPDSPERGSILLRIARSAIETRLIDERVAGRAEEGSHDADWLRERRATFVTLHVSHVLRGCIGTVEPVRPLGEDVHTNALAAAFADPRFPPLVAPDLETLSVEVSLLSPRVPIAARHEDEALAQLAPGRHGLVLRHGGRRATFLPQVWASLPEPLDFLAALKEKAGLAPDFWHQSIELSTYTVESWSEPNR